MRTATASPSPAAFQAPVLPLPAWGDGPVIIAARPQEDQHVLRAGALAAAALGRRADVVSALDPSQLYGWEPGYGAYPRSVIDAMIEDRAHDLERSMEGHGFAAHRILVELGGVAQVATEMAGAADAALVVIGIGRHRPIDRLLGIEAALRVVQRSHRPVLAVPRSFDRLPSAVAVGVDFSDAGWHAAACALGLMTANGTLHLVHAWQPSDLADAESTASDERYRHDLPMRFHELTESLTIPPGIAVQHEAREGRVAERLLDYAEAHRIDMLVVGRHGRGWLERLRVGSVATNVLRGAGCAVLVVPEPPPHRREHAPVVHGRAGVVVDPDRWAGELDGFARRNAGRTVILETSDLASGAFSQERGYVLFGTAYRPGTGEVEIVLGEAHGRSRHLTNTLRAVTSVTIVREADGTDHALKVAYGSGRTLLTVVSPGVSR